MRGGGYADVLPVLQVPDNKADAVPCERLPILHTVSWYLSNSITLNLVCNFCFAVFLRKHQFIMEKSSLFTVKAQGNKERNAWNLTDILGLTNEVKRYYTVSYL